VSKNDKLDIDKMYLSVVDDKLGYAVIPDSYVNWDLFEDDDSDERTIYQIEGPRETIAHDIHNKALAEVICKVPQMMWELKRMYDKEDLCAEHCKKLWSQLKKRDEEIDVLQRKIKLLDVLNDTDNALDKEILSSDILRESELEGLYDEATLKEYDYYD